MLESELAKKLTRRALLRWMAFQKICADDQKKELEKAKQEAKAGRKR